MLVYLNRGSNPRASLEHAQLTSNLLTDLGFSGNLKKSVLTPIQQTEYFGFLVNSIKMKRFQWKKNC